MFSENPDVAFGDVNLSEEQVRDGHNPGAGGWPTVRYFNKETGYGGAAYVKKTDKAMCDELGDISYMQACVEENAQTSLCNAVTGAGCGDKEKAYLEKMKSKSANDIVSQQERLIKMASGSMAPDLMDWVTKRLAILKQLAPKAEL